MTDKDFDFTRRTFLDSVLKATAAAGVATAAPWVIPAARAELAKGDPVRLGVIGTGDRGRTLIRNIAKTRNCTVAALCDNYAPHLAKARALVGAATPVFSDHRAMLDAGGLDAVVIATPLDMHAPLALDAFDAGLHVWCEKAMARTIADCTTMVRKSQERRRVLQIGHQRMFHPTYLNALKRVKSGEIGEVTQIRASWHRNTSWRRPVPADTTDRKINWRLYRDSSAGLMTGMPIARQRAPL